MTVGKPQWKIEIRESTYPVERWTDLRHETGKRYAFVDRGDAESAAAVLRRVQPHLVLRIVRM